MQCIRASVSHAIRVRQPASESEDLAESEDEFEYATGQQNTEFPGTGKGKAKAVGDVGEDEETESDYSEILPDPMDPVPETLTDFMKLRQFDPTALVAMGKCKRE